MNITMLGTGNALVTECYNTCYVYTDETKDPEHRYFMVDAGGGGQIFTQLKAAGIDWKQIHEIFLTHKHIDHFTGMIWMVRLITQNMKAGKYDGDTRIYGHAEVIELLDDICRKLLQPEQIRFIGKRLQLIPVEDGETRIINDHRFTFFDIGSTKTKQFGYTMETEDGKKICCCGDEPYNAAFEERYAKDADWLLHEAFCLYDERDAFHPYEKHHSTVKDAAELAAGLRIPSLLLYHTEDKNIKNRKELYTSEASRYYDGRIEVPEDLETIPLA